MSRNLQVMLSGFHRNFHNNDGFSLRGLESVDGRRRRHSPLNFRARRCRKNSSASNQVHTGAIGHMCDAQPNVLVQVLVLCSVTRRKPTDHSASQSRDQCHTQCAFHVASASNRSSRMSMRTLPVFSSSLGGRTPWPFSRNLQRPWGWRINWKLYPWGRDKVRGPRKSSR